MRGEIHANAVQSFLEQALLMALKLSGFRDQAVDDLPTEYLDGVGARISRLP